MPQHRTKILVAKTIRTMDESIPAASAVAVTDGRITAVGTLDDVIESMNGELFELDSTHADDVLLPGLIDQHLHPLLAATTLATEVIATEDWVLPSAPSRPPTRTTSTSVVWLQLMPSSTTPTNG